MRYIRNNIALCKFIGENSNRHILMIEILFLMTYWDLWDAIIAPYKLHFAMVYKYMFCYLLFCP